MTHLNQQEEWYPSPIAGIYTDMTRMRREAALWIIMDYYG